MLLHQPELVRLLTILPYETSLFCAAAFIPFLNFRYRAGLYIRS